MSVVIWRPRLAPGIGLLAVLGCAEPGGAGSITMTASAEPIASASASSMVFASASSVASADVVSGASPSQEAGGPSVIASGAVDGAALRAKHRDRIAKDTSPVTILKGESALELGQRICEAVVPKRGPATPILIKPNLCGIDAVKKASASGDDGVRGRITDPEFVRGIVRCLKARGHTKITVGEGCGLGREAFATLARVSGYAAMTQEESVAFVRFDDDGAADVEGDQPGKPLAVTGMEQTPVPTLMLPKVVAEHLDHGMFISAPKLKTHRFSVVSMAIKGNQGLVLLSDRSPAHQQKWRMHRELHDYMKTLKPDEMDDRAKYVASLEKFADRMAAVLEIAAPDVVLADGAPAMGGDGFQLLEPLPQKVAIGGTNPIRVDRVGADYLGLWDSDKLALALRGHRTSPLITVAAKKLGVDLATVEVVGDGADVLASKRPVSFKAIAPFAIHTQVGSK